MPVEEMKEAVKIIRSANPQIEIEASGRVTLENITKIAELDLDYISCGALTHSVKALDVSLELDKGSVDPVEKGL
jgi:nicotinate-nucleotide pyrophosphorylase (carboxylating)